MFNVGGGELFVIILVALMVLGPQRLPGAMRQAGQFVGELRKMSSNFQREMKSALDEADDTKPTPGTAADRLAVTDTSASPSPAVVPDDEPDGSVAAATTEPLDDLGGRADDAAAS